MKDFTKSNKWNNLKKKMSPTEKSIADYMELMERQMIALEKVVHSLMKGEDDGETTNEEVQS